MNEPYRLSRRALFGLGAIGLGATGLASLSSCSANLAEDSPSVEITGGEFSFMSWMLEDEHAASLINKSLSEYMASASCAISALSSPHEGYLRRLLSLIKNGEFTGIAQIESKWLAAVASTDKLVDFSGSVLRGSYIQRALQAGQYAGNQYGLPWSYGGIGIIAHKDNLKAVGIHKMPATVDDFDQVLREIKAGSDQVIPYAMVTKGEDLADFVTWMQVFGSTIVDNNTCVLGDDASVQAMIWIKQLLDDGLIAADMDRAKARTLYSQGTVGFYEDSAMAKADALLRGDDPLIAEQMIPMSRPVIKAGNPIRTSLWEPMLVLVGTDWDPQAIEFARWFTSNTEHSVSLFTELGVPPVSPDGLADERVKSDRFFKQFKNKVSASAEPSPLWNYRKYEEIHSTLREQITSVLEGQVPAAAALKAAGAEITRIIRT